MGVIQNELRMVLASMSQKCVPPYSCWSGSIGISENFDFCTRLQHFIYHSWGWFESSSLKGKEECFASFGHLIRNVKIPINSFNGVSFSHIWRHDNFITHNHTKHAKHISSLPVWIDDIPLHFNAIILAGITKFITHARHISGLLVLTENILLYPNPTILSWFD